MNPVTLSDRIQVFEKQMVTLQDSTSCEGEEDTLQLDDSSTLNDACMTFSSDVDKLGKYTEDNDQAGILKEDMEKVQEEVVTKTDDTDGENPIINSEETCTKKQNQINPLTDQSNITILHFILNAPKWSLSLFVFLANTSIPLLTPYEAIHKPVERMRKAVELESKSYLECTMRAFDRRYIQLMELANHEYDRVRHIQASNQNIIHKARSATGACINATKKSRNSLVQLINQGMIIPFVDNLDICSEIDREDVLGFLREDFRVVENELSTVFEDYFQSSHHSLELIQTYSEARISYDLEYFVTNKTGQALTVLENWTIPPFRAFVDKDALESQIRSNLRQLETTLQQAHSRIEVLHNRAQEFADSIQNLHQAYTDVYDRLLQGATFIQDLLPPGAPMPAIFDLSSVPLGDSLLPPIMQVPSYRDELASTQEILYNITNQTMHLIDRIIKEIENEATNQLLEASNNLARELSELLFFTDYNPPKFMGSMVGITNLSAEVTFITEYAETARVNIIKSWDKLQGLGNVEVDQLPPKKPTINSESYSFSDNSTVFSYLRPAFPKISFPDLFEGLLTLITVHTWILDMIIQFLRLLRLEYLYSRKAHPDLPEIDFRTTDDDTSDKKTEKWRLFVFTFLKTFATPWIIVIFILIPTVIGAKLFWYPHVQEKCENSRNGTVLANNILTPLLINEANALGNLYYTKAEIECQTRQRQLCHQMRRETDTIRQSDVSTLETTQNQLEQSRNKLGLIKVCIDPKIDLYFQQACCGLKGYGIFSECLNVSTSSFICPIDETVQPPAAFRPLSEYTSEQGCVVTTSSEDWKLDDSNFDCSILLGVCNQDTCNNGVNEEKLQSLIIESDCQIQRYIIKSILFLFVLTYHAILINVICTLLFNGIRQVLWRYFCPDGITFRTQLDETGNILYGCGNSKEQRSEQIMNAINRYEVFGKVQLIIGFILFVIWFISIFFIP